MLKMVPAILIRIGYHTISQSHGSQKLFTEQSSSVKKSSAQSATDTLPKRSTFSATTATRSGSHKKKKLHPSCPKLFLKLTKKAGWELRLRYTTSTKVNASKTPAAKIIYLSNKF